MQRYAAALAASHYLRSSASEGSTGLGMLPGPAQSWTTAVLCTLPFMANRGTGRGEERDRHTRGPALLRLTWDQPTLAFSPPGTEHRIGLSGVDSFGQPCPRVGFAPDDDLFSLRQTTNSLPLALYCLKIYLFRSQLKLMRHEGMELQRFFLLF